MAVEKISLIIIAMQEEFDYFLSGLDVNYIVIDLGFGKGYFFKKGDTQYLAMMGKIGKVSTAFYLGKIASQYKIDRIFNIGTSGGYHPSLRVGDIVIATEVVYHDVDATGFNYALGQVPGFPKSYACDLDYLKNKPLPYSTKYKVYFGKVLSGDSFITKKNISHFNIENTDGYCVEMEAGSVGQCAYLMNVPFVVIRSISDIITADHNSKDSVFNLDTACKNNVQVLLSLI